MFSKFQPMQTNQAYNVFPYHEVYANAFAQVLMHISNKQPDDAKRLTIATIVSVKALNEKKYNLVEMEKQDIYSLIYEMISEEKKAGITPLQTHQTSSTFNRAKKYAESLLGEKK